MLDRLKFIIFLNYDSDRSLDAIDKQRSKYQANDEFNTHSIG